MPIPLPRFADTTQLMRDPARLLAALREEYEVARTQEVVLAGKTPWTDALLRMPVGALWGNAVEAGGHAIGWVGKIRALDPLRALHDEWGQWVRDAWVRSTYEDANLDPITFQPLSEGPPVATLQAMEAQSGVAWVDLAMEARAWPLVDALWAAGFRWSQAARDDNRVLMRLMDGVSDHWSRGAHQPFYRDGVAWLNTWLGRWEASGKPYRATAVLSRRGGPRGEAEGEEMPEGFKETPVQYWLAHTLRKKVTPSTSRTTTTVHQQALVQRMVDFWQSQGVNLLAQRVTLSDGARFGVASLWRPIPLLADHEARLQAEVRARKLAGVLEAQLNDPVSPSPSARARPRM